jgi:hypothetical protein
MMSRNVCLHRWAPCPAIALLAGLACGSSDSSEPPSANGASGGSTSAPAPPAQSQAGAPANPIPPEAIAAVTDAIGMAAGQVQSACGATFEGCSATPGCNEILACATRNACAGSACYCTDASCETDGPCRSVIDAAPGARTPDAADDSFGPAADAAVAVGDCIGGLGAALFPMPPLTPPSSSADGGDPSDAPDAG